MAGKPIKDYKNIIMDVPDLDKCCGLGGGSAEC